MEEEEGKKEGRKVGGNGEGIQGEMGKGGLIAAGPNALVVRGSRALADWCLSESIFGRQRARR